MAISSAGVKKCLICLERRTEAKRLCRCGSPKTKGAKICARCRREGANRRNLVAACKRYGITVDDYNALMVAQDGGCAICGNKPRTQRLAIDHSHTTGLVRGLLCKRCNHNLLGASNDSVDLLQRAITYLGSPPASTVIGTPA